MTYEEEREFLAQFIDEADGGHITDVSAIKAAYDEKIGRETGHGQIYNEVFQTLEKVVDRLCDTICNLSAEAIHNITCCNWISSCFN